MSGTGISTQVAVTAKRHVDIELGHPQFNGSSISCKDRSFFLGALFRRHVNAIDWTGAHTLATTNAVFNFVEKPHPRSFRQSPSLVGILKRAGAGEKMFKSDLHSQQHGPNRLDNIFEILLHGNSLIRSLPKFLLQ